VKTIFLLAVIVTFTVQNISAQHYQPADYFPLQIGNWWNYAVVHDTTNPSNDRRSRIEVVDSTTFSIPGETVSYKVEYSEWFEGGQDTSVYRTTYYSFNANGDLGFTANLFDTDLTVYDSLIVYLKNPITVGDTTYLHSSGYEVCYAIKSITDTIDLPIGYFENSLQIHTHGTLDGIPVEDAYEYYIPISYLPTAAGMGMRNRTHWFAHPDSFIYGYSNLIDCYVETSVEIENNFIANLPSFSLQQNYPNPFNPTTEMKYHIPQDSHVTLKVINVRGQQVVTLVNDHLSAGSYTATWNGLNANGQEVSSGIYFCTMRAGEFDQTRKMVLLR
jgi:hypothetical protein